MTGSAEAIAHIREFTEQAGRPMDLSEVLVTNEPGIAGIGLDRQEEITINRTDRRYAAARNLSGLFECRTVLIAPEQSTTFFRGLDEPVEGATSILARLTYRLPESKLSESGIVTNTAEYRLLPDDPAKIDAHFDALATYDAAAKAYCAEIDPRRKVTKSLRVGVVDHPGEEPQMPHINKGYRCEYPPAKRHLKDDCDNDAVMARLRQLAELSTAFMRLAQQQYPEMSILSSDGWVRISKEELPRLAEWLVQAA